METESVIALIIGIQVYWVNENFTFFLNVPVLYVKYEVQGKSNLEICLNMIHSRSI